MCPAATPSPCLVLFTLLLKLYAQKSVRPRTREPDEPRRTAEEHGTPPIFGMSPKEDLELYERMKASNDYGQSGPLRKCDSHSERMRPASQITA